MRADLGALLDHDHADVGRNLLEADRGGEAGGPGADDDDVEFHCFTSRYLTSRYLTSRYLASGRFGHGLLLVSFFHVCIAPTIVSAQCAVIKSTLAP